MTTEHRLKGRLSFLNDLGCLTDEVNGMVYVILDRELDMSLTELKWLTRPRFTAYLENVQESYLKHTKQ